MTKVKPKVRRQMVTLFCALLLFGQIFVSAAYADREQNVNISYTVTEDMLPKPVPTATPHPGKGEPPKTGDESKVLVYGLLAASSALAALGLFVFLNKKEEEDLTHE